MKNSPTNPELLETTLQGLYDGLESIGQTANQSSIQMKQKLDEMTESVKQLSTPYGHELLAKGKEMYDCINLMAEASYKSCYNSFSIKLFQLRAINEKEKQSEHYSRNRQIIETMEQKIKKINPF